MTLSNLLAGVRSSLAARGPLDTVRHLSRAFPYAIPTHPFDLRHQVDTSGLIEPAQLLSGHPHDFHNTAYWGTAPSFFNAALARWAQTIEPQDIAAYSFVDIGCGKGRVLMLASEHPFLQVVGVELNPTLVSIARVNLVQWRSLPRACPNLEVLNADALRLSLPSSRVLLYLFHPFDAHIMRLFADHLQALAADRTHTIDLIYVHPDHECFLLVLPGMTLLWHGEVPFSPEDTRADYLRGRGERCSILRLSLQATPATE
jgi:SAM-dependent methyltransferase